MILKPPWRCPTNTLYLLSVDRTLCPPILSGEPRPLQTRFEISYSYSIGSPLFPLVSSNFVSFVIHVFGSPHSFKPCNPYRKLTLPTPYFTVTLYLNFPVNGGVRFSSRRRFAMIKKNPHIQKELFPTRRQGTTYSLEEENRTKLRTFTFPNPTQTEWRRVFCFYFYRSYWCTSIEN